MAKKTLSATSAAPDWISKVYAQICRYYPNDERPAKTKEVSVDGPMLQLALELGIRGWNEKAREPITTKDILAMRKDRAFKSAFAYADFTIDDEETGAEDACLWLLSGRNAEVHFISPGYKQLQAQRELDIERNKIARQSRKPKPPAEPTSDRDGRL